VRTQAKGGRVVEPGKAAPPTTAALP
jgi:hypothetical protein